MWCRREDLNLHELPHTPLKRARLPVPPLRLHHILQRTRVFFTIEECSIISNKRVLYVGIYDLQVS